MISPPSSERTNRDSARRLVIACEHPDLPTGFATVGRNIAECLTKDSEWSVKYLGINRAPGQREMETFAYEVFEVGAPLDRDDGRFIDALKRLLGEHEGDKALCILSIGPGYDQLALLELLTENHWRQDVTFVAYMPIDYGPLPPLFGSLLAEVDYFVPYTRNAAQIVEDWCWREDGDFGKVSQPIPHGVRTDIFRPSTLDVRRAVRRDSFRLRDDDLLIGYFGKNSRHKRAELAVRIFQLLVHGKYATCSNCGSLKAFQLDPVDMQFIKPITCSGCSCVELKPGKPFRKAKLYLHSDDPEGKNRHHSGGWDLRVLARRLAVDNQIVWSQSLPDPDGVGACELARRMSACDIHLLPYESGGWELTVLETGACGVPNVITDFAAPPEYARPFARLIPIGPPIFETTGIRGLMDIEFALAALLELGSSHSARRVLGKNGLEVAKEYAWPRVTRLWNKFLRSAIDKQVEFNRNRT